MNNSIVFFLTGLIIGGLATGFALYKSSPELMLKENQSKYNFEESMEILETEVEKNGWKIPNKHDLQATMIKFGKKGIEKVTVIELCNPDLAADILANDKTKIVSNMMPCRIALYQKSNGQTYYSRMNTGILAKAMGGIIKDKMTVANKEMEDFLKVIETER
ncbi:MAG: DUF302 domain-containing protein [Bacteroidota bacterium]